MPKMDKSLMKKLEQIQAKSHKRKDLNKLFVKSNVFAEQKAIAEEALRNPKVPEAGKEKLRRALARGMFDRERLEVNEKMSRKIEYDTQETIRAEIRAGRLPKHNIKNDPQALRWLRQTGRLKN